MSDEELSVVIEPEVVEPEVEVKTTDEAPPKREKIERTTEPAIDDLKSQVAELTEQREADKKAREAAIAWAQALEAEVARANQRASESDLNTITTAIDQAQAEIDQAKKDIRAAKDAGDGDAEVDAIDRMTTAKATFLRLDESKADAEARKKAPPRRDPDTGQFVPSDPVEAYVANRTRPTADWLRAHSEFITDKRKNDKLTAAHYDALGDGLEPDTKAYFAHVESYLKLGEPAIEAAPAAKPRKQAETAPVAPAGRVANGGTAPSNEVRLSAGEARSATDGTLTWNWNDPKGKFKKGDPIGIQEMARRKQIMDRRGDYDKSKLES